MTVCGVTFAAGGDVVSIAAGAEHSLAATSAGEVLSWGSTANGRLGRRHRRWHPARAALRTCQSITNQLLPLAAVAWQPKPVSTWEGRHNQGCRIKHITQHRSCICSGWRLWQSHERTPRLLRSLAGTRITSVAAGLLHSGARPSRCNSAVMTGDLMSVLLYISIVTTRQKDP